MKYMIHACNSRMWYVNDYLLPSMLEQGISKEDIYVYQDTKREGNLVSFVVSCHEAYEMWGEENVWHLQDDVLLCRDFKKRTEELESFDGIIQAFASEYDEDIPPGESLIQDNLVWWSFPCIRINGKIGKLFANWVDIYVWRDNQFHFWIKYKKGDDIIFKIYAESYQKKTKVLRLAPNLVEHIDWLINGSTITRRDKAVRSAYWNDEELVKQLEKELEK